MVSSTDSTGNLFDDECDTNTTSDIPVVCPIDKIVLNEIVNKETDYTVQLQQKVLNADKTVDSSFSNERQDKSTRNYNNSIPKMSSKRNKATLHCKIVTVFLICCVITCCLIPIILYYISQATNNNFTDLEYLFGINISSTKVCCKLSAHICSKNIIVMC